MPKEAQISTARTDIPKTIETRGEPSAETSLSEIGKLMGVSSEELPKETSSTEDPLKTEKAMEEGEKTVKEYSGLIQEYSEDLYDTMVHRAKTEEDFLEKALQSENKIEQKVAKKVLKRNKELFGTEDPDEFLLLRKKEQAKDDPSAQDRIELKGRIVKLEKEAEVQRWEAWKERQKVEGDLASMADSIHSEYPNLSYGDCVIVAKGRLGHRIEGAVRRETSVVGGSVAVSKETEEEHLDPKMLRDFKLEKKDFEFARVYKASI